MIRFFLRGGAMCLLAVAWPMASSALTITFKGTVVSVPSDADLLNYYLSTNDPPADPADYLFDRPAIGTPATVTVVINDLVMKEPLEPGTGDEGLGSQDFSATAIVPTYISSMVRPRYYPYTNEENYFSLSMDDGTYYLRSRPPLYSNGRDNSIDVVEFFYASSGEAPSTVGQLAKRLRQKSTTGQYHADLGDVSTGLYVHIAFASPGVVPLPATVWLGLGAMGMLFAAARRRDGGHAAGLRTV
jgi:hypothetical protein